MNVVVVVAFEEKNKLKRQLAQTGHLWAVEEMLEEHTNGVRDYAFFFTPTGFVVAAIRVYKQVVQWGIETTFGDVVDYLTEWTSATFSQPAPSIIVQTVGI